MVEFRALEALEYSEEAGAFEDLISPPYDVIDAAARAKLAAKNAHNIVHVILPEASGGMDKYAAAGALVKRWRSDGVLVAGGRAFYVIEQTFASGGKKRVRTALLGQARLAAWREGGIHPHEVTLPKPRADRMNLYKATGVVPGPCFSLFEDAQGTVRALVEKIKTRSPYRVADGPEGSYDRIWKVTGEEETAAITEAFEGEDFFIADGHHRYETALAYRDELAKAGKLADSHPANFVLMGVVPFDDAGLVMLPTHRLLCLEGERSVTESMEALASDYEMEKVESLEAFSRVDEQAPAPIALYDGKASYLLKMKAASRRAFVAEAGEVMAGLNVYEAREKVMGKFFGDVAGAIAAEHVKYTHSVQEALEAVDRKTCAAALILSPISVRQMAEVASAGRTMPPKSTYFYPKLPTGVAIKPLTSTI